MGPTSSLFKLLESTLNVV